MKILYRLNHMNANNKYVLIRSLSRNVTSADSSSFQINMPANTYVPAGCDSLRLEHFLMYSTVYNVSTTNQNLDFTVTGAPSNPYTAVIPTGIYTGATFGTALATALNSAYSNTFTATYNATNMLLTVGGASNFQLLFSTGSHVNSQNNLWQVMGFATTLGTAGIDTTSGTSTTSTQVVNFSLPLSFYINIQGMDGKYLTSDQKEMALYIPNNASTGGGIVQYKGTIGFEQKLRLPANTAVIQAFNVQIQGPAGQLLNLNGSEWEMLFSFCS